MPRKNIKLLGGRPLIAWTIDAACKSTMLDYFLVSTNDSEIAKISKRCGAPVPFKRPAKLSEDVDTCLVLQHAVEKVEAKKDVVVSYVVCLQPTSPFRVPADIDECVRIAKATGVDSVVSFRQATEHPYWMFQTKLYGHEMEPFMNEVKLEGDNLVIQKLPILFYPNGAVYVTRRDVLMSGRIYGDKVYGYKMPRIRSVDIEEQEDLIYAEAVIPYLMSNEPIAKITWLVS